MPEPTPPLPQPAKPAPELPEAPTPHNLTPTPQPPPPQPTQQPQPSQLEPIKPQPNHLNLQLPTSSPGELLRQQEEDAIKRQNQGGSYSTGGRLPGGAGAQGPSANAQVRTLSPTEGVDFNSYIQRMLDTIQRNWYAIMPQSAMLGDKGIVYVTYTINPDGSIQAEDPELQRTSQKEPLDKAAMASIRASNPFEPLPKEFHGPSMKFGIIFLYNVPLESLNH